MIIHFIYNGKEISLDFDLLAEKEKQFELFCGNFLFMLLTKP